MPLGIEIRGLRWQRLPLMARCATRSIGYLAEARFCQNLHETRLKKGKKGVWLWSICHFL
jgi:hypothetical protein